MLFHELRRTWPPKVLELKLPILTIFSATKQHRLNQLHHKLRDCSSPGLCKAVVTLGSQQ